ncbi:hypothetical protein [Maridesulfovibrio sp.]|nr:hypothetical protein [Maridesulfovibrio sp.]
MGDDENEVTPPPGGDDFSDFIFEETIPEEPPCPAPDSNNGSDH